MSANNEKIYITQSIVNISDLQEIIQGCCITAQILLREYPENERLNLLYDDLKKALDFEFCIEVRKATYRDE